MRTGWTTGTCTAAAAKAAVIGLLNGELPPRVQIKLPSGTAVEFPVVPGPVNEATATAGVVKDAGDDPDCTNGAVLTVEARWEEPPEQVSAQARPLARSSPHEAHPVEIHPAGEARVTLIAGQGVGVVTKAGLGLEIGSPAITAVPRRMIAEAVRELTNSALWLTVSVPGGLEMASKTTNARLGIIGGISILGTTGIVRPFSTAAYRASVVQQVDVAAAQGEKEMVFATGSRTEAMAGRLWPHLDPVCVVEVGDFTGIALRRAASHSLEGVHLVYMAGKIAKLAAGVMMTHFHRSGVDTGLLASIAREAGAPPAVIMAAGETATARHFYESCLANGFTEPLRRLCVLAAQSCRSHSGNKLDIDVYMVDYEGSAVVAHG